MVFVSEATVTLLKHDAAEKAPEEVDSITVKFDNYQGPYGGWFARCMRLHGQHKIRRIANSNAEKAALLEQPAVSIAKGMTQIVTKLREWTDRYDVAALGGQAFTAARRGAWP